MIGKGVFCIGGYLCFLLHTPGLSDSNQASYNRGSRIPMQFELGSTSLAILDCKNCSLEFTHESPAACCLSLHLCSSDTLPQRPCEKMNCDWIQHSGITRALFKHRQMLLLRKHSASQWKLTGNILLTFTRKSSCKE